MRPYSMAKSGISCSRAELPFSHFHKYFRPHGPPGVCLHLMFGYFYTKPKDPEEIPDDISAHTAWPFFTAPAALGFPANRHGTELAGRTDHQPPVQRPANAHQHTACGYWPVQLQQDEPGRRAGRRPEKGYASVCGQVPGTDHGLVLLSR